MTENEVRAILVEELTGKNNNTGLVNAYYRILLSFLEKWSRDWVEEAKFDLMKEAVFSKSRLCIFMAMEDGSEFQGNAALFENLLFVYRNWLKVIQYLCENYSSIDCARFKELWSPFDLFEMRKAVVLKCLRLEKEIQTNKSAGFNSEEMPIIDEMLSLIFLVILGEEIMKMFISEANEAFSFLKKYQAELVSVENP